VNQTTHSGNGPWWETELPSIRKEQRAYLRRHLPAFSSDHDDLLNDTLLALTEHIQRRRSSLPESWFGYVEPKKEAEQQRLHAVARIILRRRIADFFRKHTHLKNVYPIASYQDKVVDRKTTSTDRKMLLARMLQITWSLLDELSQKDRDLVALISDDPDFPLSLNDTERKRLERLRIKLKKRVARELGAEAADLFRSSL
jgi:DNA-directed RNA polymerase specialized sigma24 family protein